MRRARELPVTSVCTALALLVMAARVVLAAPGDLDPSFDGDGKKTWDYGGFDEAYAVAVQPDGKIVVVGAGNPNSDFAITRLNPDGSFDPTFDGGGTVSINFGLIDVGQAVALQPDGKIVVAGFTHSAVSGDVAVLRLRPNGSLDLDFDVDGSVTIDYGGVDDAASAVLVQPDGKIVVVGHGNPNLDVAITRLNPDGSPDATFDGDGTVGVNLGGDDDGVAAALQADGKIVIAGFTSLSQSTVVLRLLPDGALDASFDFDGVRTISYGGLSAGTGIAVQSDGNILVGGWGGPSGDFTVARLDPSGGADTSFAGDGARFVNLGGDDSARTLLLQPNGKIVLVGDRNEFDVAAVRLNTDASLDFSFDGIGSLLVNFGGEERAKGAALQADGKIVVVGDARLSNADHDIIVARIEGDPPVTTSTTLPPAATDYPVALELAVVKPGRLLKLVAKGSFTLPDPAADSPTDEGGSLTVSGSTGTATYLLGAGSWTALGRHHDGSKGYRFAGAGCATVLVKPRALKAVCREGTGTLTLPEPGPLTIVIAIGRGTTRYCGTCGGTPQGKPARVFKRRACAAPAGCP
jgi:uncharacterized delta-60 repeat protein